MKDRQAFELLTVSTCVEHKTSVQTDVCVGPGGLGRLPAARRRLRFLGTCKPCSDMDECISPCRYRLPHAPKIPECGGIHIAETDRKNVASRRARSQSILLRQRWNVLQTRPCHLHQRTGASLRNISLNRVKRSNSTRRCAHHFFCAISFIAAIARSRSASGFFSRAFSCPKVFRCFISLTSISPNRLRQP